jgi:hypothetical protein
MVEKEEAFLCGITNALRTMGILQQVCDQVSWSNVGLTITDFDRWIKNHDKELKENKSRKYGDCK